MPSPGLKLWEKHGTVWQNDLVMQISASLLVTVVYGWEARKPLVGFGYFSNNSEIWRGFEPAGIFNFSRKANILCRSQAATPTFLSKSGRKPQNKAICRNLSAAKNKFAEIWNFDTECDNGFVPGSIHSSDFKLWSWNFITTSLTSS